MKPSDKAERGPLKLQFSHIITDIFSGAIMKIRLLFMIILTFLIIPGLFAFDIDNTTLHIHLAGLSNARAPEIVEDWLVLSVKGQYRYVGAAFSHENWSKTHAFEKNREGVWVLAIPLPYGDASHATYRLILDGLWVADPSNPERVLDRTSGVSLSVLHFPGRSRTVLGVWDPAGPDGAVFWFKGMPGERVSVAGNFNAWDPFIHELEEIAPGEYMLKLNLPVGEYYYVFVYRNEFIPDPLNSQMLYSRDGRYVSWLKISGK